jgi:hypothetical protein
MLLAGQSFSLDPGVEFSVDPGDGARITAADAPNLLEPFVGFGSGLTLDSDDPNVVLAYVHADDETAQANAEPLRELLQEGTSLRTGEPWSVLFTVDTIRTDGPTLVARLGLGTGGRPGLAHDIVHARDSLAMHQ